MVFDVLAKSDIGKSVRALETFSECELLTHHGKSDGGNSISGTGNRIKTTVEMAIDDEDHVPQKIEELDDHLGKMDEPELSSSTSSEALSACVVEDSEEQDSHNLVVSTENDDPIEIINLEENIMETRHETGYENIANSKAVETCNRKRTRLSPEGAIRRLFC